VEIYVYHEVEEIVEEWHMVARYVMSKDVVIYDPSFVWNSQTGKIAKVSFATRRSVLMAFHKYQNLRGSNGV
jgi:hypothetical protein